MTGTNSLAIGMLVCRPDGHAIGKVECVDAETFSFNGLRLSRRLIARLSAGRVYLDAAAGRYLANM